MAEKSPAQHFAETILVAGGIGTAGADLFYNKAPDERPTTGPIVVVIDSGGLNPSKNAHRTHRTPSIEILVFGISEGFDAAQQKMADVQNYIVDTLPPTTVGSTKYFGYSQQGDVFDLGEDANKRPQFSANFSLNRRAA